MEVVCSCGAGAAACLQATRGPAERKARALARRKRGTFSGRAAFQGALVFRGALVSSGAPCFREPLWCVVRLGSTINRAPRAAGLDPERAFS